MRLLDEWKQFIRNEAGVGARVLDEDLGGVRADERRLAQMIYRAAMQYQEEAIGVPGPRAHDAIGEVVAQAARVINEALLRAKQ